MYPLGSVKVSPITDAVLMCTSDVLGLFSPKVNIQLLGLVDPELLIALCEPLCKTVDFLPKQILISLISNLLMLVLLVIEFSLCLGLELCFAV